MDLTIDYVDEDEISLDQFKVQAKELIKHERDTQNYIKKRLINNIMESNTLNVLSTRSTKTVTYKKDCDALGEYSYAAEPPVQFRLSHLSRRSEPL